MRYNGVIVGISQPGEYSNGESTTVFNSKATKGHGNNQSLRQTCLRPESGGDGSGKPENSDDS